MDATYQSCVAAAKFLQTDLISVVACCLGTVLRSVSLECCLQHHVNHLALNQCEISSSGSFVEEFVD